MLPLPLERTSGCLFFRERNDIRTGRAFQIVKEKPFTTKATTHTKSLGSSGLSKDFFVPFVVKSSFDYPLNMRSNRVTGS
jgi:hypothetical protein